MALSHFMMLIDELLNKNLDIVPEEAPLIVLISKSDMCMPNISKDTNHTRHIASKIHFVSNGEKCKMRNIDWYEVGLKLAYIGTNNVGENDLIPRIKYIMVRLDNLDRTCVQEGRQNTV